MEALSRRHRFGAGRIQRVLFACVLRYDRHVRYAGDEKDRRRIGRFFVDVPTRAHARRFVQYEKCVLARSRRGLRRRRKSCIFVYHAVTDRRRCRRIGKCRRRRTVERSVQRADGTAGKNRRRFSVACRYLRFARYISVRYELSFRRGV